MYVQDPVTQWAFRSATETLDSQLFIQRSLGQLLWGYQEPLLVRRGQGGSKESYQVGASMVLPPGEVRVPGHFGLLAGRNMSSEGRCGAGRGRWQVLQVHRVGRGRTGWSPGPGEGGCLGGCGLLHSLGWLLQQGERRGGKPIPPWAGGGGGPVGAGPVPTHGAGQGGAAAAAGWGRGAPLRAAPPGADGQAEVFHTSPQVFNYSSPGHSCYCLPPADCSSDGVFYVAPCKFGAPLVGPAMAPILCSRLSPGPTSWAPHCTPGWLASSPPGSTTPSTCCYR